jgi:valyl-tRNA synthetase
MWVRRDAQLNWSHDYHPNTDENTLRPPKHAKSVRLQDALDTSHKYKDIENILTKQVNAKSINYVSESINQSIVVAVEKDKFYLQTEQVIDAGALKDELLKDLQHQQKFLESVIKKLSNQRFVANAKPEVVELERKKQSDAEARIKVLEETLTGL